MTMDYANFVRGYFETTTEQYIQRGREGHFNAHRINDLGVMSGLLGYDDLVEKLGHLWEDCVNGGHNPYGARWMNGVPISNAIERYRSYPIGTLPPYFVEMLAQVNQPNRVTLCMEGRYEEAVAKAHDASGIEDVAAILVVLGDLAAAQVTLQKIPERDQISQNLISLIRVIEGLRTGDSGEAIDLMNERFQQHEHSYLWDAAFIARGIAGYEPWMVYPFNDW